MSQVAEAIGQRFFEEQDRLRGGPADELCADGYTLFVGGSPPMDLEGHKQFSAAFYSVFPDLRHTVEEVVAEGDHVGVRFRLTGTNIGSFMGKPPTGKPINIGGAIFMRCVSGRVTEAHGLFDQLSLLQQLGLLPA